MKTQDFDYKLPQELIAQHPLDSRDDSRLLVLDSTGKLVDSNFYDIHNFLLPGDLLVLNDSKVVKASLNLNKAGKNIYVILNKQLTNTIWTGFAKPGKKLYIGDNFDFDGNQVIIKNKFEDGTVEFEFELKTGFTVFDFLDIYGSVPLPPYIRKGVADSLDEDTYQSIFAENLGSVAAPTAGLHFTDHVFVQLNKKNIDYCFITLHVGAGTYMPVKSENIDEHRMHSEYVEISSIAAEKINNAKREGRRVISVGTTSTRALEASAIENGMVKASKFETDIFIKPGFDFKVIDGLITNFHIPKSTLLMLVSSFIGHKNIMNIYSHAIANKYRFYSYGDAMLVIKNLK